MAGKSSAGPMDQGSKQGQIATPMCEENVGHKNEPKVHTYKDMPSKTGGSGASSILGPGKVYDKGKR